MFKRVLGFLAGAVLMAAGANSFAFVLDGVLSAGDAYSVVVDLPLVFDSGGVVAPDATLRIGRGANSDGVTGGASDIFLLLEVPKEVKDITSGANTAPGWDKPGLDKIQKYDKAQGSEKWVFKLDGEEVELKLKDVGFKKDGTGGHTGAAAIGHELKEDGDGNVVAGRTSLDYNLTSTTFGDTARSEFSDSPKCGATLGSPTSDADCYANVDPTFADWEFANIYEVQIAGSVFGGNLADFTSHITMAAIHASPNKQGEKNEIKTPCLDGTSTGCNGGPPPSVPEPATGLLLMVGLAGLAAARRKKRHATA